MICHLFLKFLNAYISENLWLISKNLLSCRRQEQTDPDADYV
jgi:hypothetical protein